MRLISLEGIRGRATFETDEERRVLWVTIPIQPEFLKNKEQTDYSKTPKRQSANSNGALDEISAEIVLKLIDEEPNITQDKLVKLTSIPRRTLQRIMSDLQGKGMLVREGGKRFGYWKHVK